MLHWQWQIPEAKEYIMFWVNFQNQGTVSININVSFCIVLFVGRFTTVLAMSLKKMVQAVV